MALSIEDISKNAKLLIDGIPYNVEEVDFTKPGKGRAIYKLKLRNLFDKGVLNRTYHSGEKVDQVSISIEKKQYLFREGDNYIFMDSDTFEQTPFSADQIGEKRFFLKEGAEVVVQMMGNRPLDINIPIFVELKVEKSSSVGKSDTITSQFKSVTMETGLEMNVPSFINEGDIIKVDTRTGAYVERMTGKK